MTHATSVMPKMALLISAPGPTPGAPAQVATPRNAALQGAVSHAALVQIAKRLYELRAIRDDVLGEALFSEPAWDILLDLFVSDHEARKLSVSAVCIGARAPSATALRYMAMLQEAGLIERSRDERDGRRSHVCLTPSGRRRMAQLLERLATA